MDGLQRDFNVTHSIGVMQGRLVPDENCTIQSFPAKRWKDEFPILTALGLNLLEWTIDLNSYNCNPICSSSGLEVINKHKQRSSIRVESITCDFVMQLGPFNDYSSKIGMLCKLVSNLVIVNKNTELRFLVLPFVDNSSPQSISALRDLCLALYDTVSSHGESIRLLLELDLAPNDIYLLMGDLPSAFGINYDTGNSASLGFDPEEELSLYGTYIRNIHIKDRKLHGKTCELGSGDFCFDVFADWYKNLLLHPNLILQAARPSKEGYEEIHIRKCLNFLDSFLSA